MKPNSLQGGYFKYLFTKQRKNTLQKVDVAIAFLVISIFLQFSYVSVSTVASFLF